MQSFYKMSYEYVKSLQVLHCMWMFIYKMNKHGFLQKCKAWLVVYENQQAPEDLPIRVIILADIMFCALMVITAKFNLEMVQLDAVNAFINCKLDEVIYMKHSSSFKTGWNIILWLQKTLYNLKRSSLLWQKKLISTFKSLEFQKIL